MRAYTLTYAEYAEKRRGTPAILFFDTDSNVRVRRSEATAAMRQYLSLQGVERGLLRCAAWTQRAAPWKEAQDPGRPRCTGWVFWLGGFLQPTPLNRESRLYSVQSEHAARLHLSVLGQNGEYHFDSVALAKSCTHVMRDVQGCPCEDRPTHTYLNWNADTQFCRNFAFLPAVYEGLKITREQYMELGGGAALSADTAHFKEIGCLGNFTYIPAAYMTTEPARGWRSTRQGQQDIYPQGVEASREVRQANARKAAETRRMQRAQCPSCISATVKGKSCGAVRWCGGTRVAEDLELAMRLSLAKKPALDLRTIPSHRFTPQQVIWLLSTANRQWSVRDAITGRSSGFELGHFRPAPGAYSYSYTDKPNWEFVLFRTAQRNLCDRNVYTSWEELIGTLSDLGTHFKTHYEHGYGMSAGLTSDGVVREDLAVAYGGLLRRAEWRGYKARAGWGNTTLDLRAVHLEHVTTGQGMLRLRVDVHSPTRVRTDFVDRWLNDSVKSRCSDWFGSPSSDDIIELVRGA